MFDSKKIFRSKNLSDQKKTILIIDYPNITNILKEVFDMYFDKKILEVLSTPHNNGKEGFDITHRRNGKIDLVITNMVMYDMDGYTLCKLIKEKYPAIKLFVITGHCKWEELDELLTSNIVVGWLRKPFKCKELLKSVREILYD